MGQTTLINRGGQLVVYKCVCVYLGGCNLVLLIIYNVKMKYVHIEQNNVCLALDEREINGIVLFIVAVIVSLLLKRVQVKVVKVFIEVLL